MAEKKNRLPFTGKTARSPIWSSFVVFLLALSLLAAFPPVGLADNIIRDPSFENGSTYWTLGDYASSFDAATARTGSKSLRIKNDGSQVNHNVWQNSIPGIKAGTEYTFSVWVKGTSLVGEGVGGKPLAVLRWRDAGNNKIEKEMYMWAPYGTYTWTQLKINLQAPPNAATVDASFRAWFGCLSGVSNWDDVVLEQRDLSYRGNLTGTYQAENASAISGGKIASLETNYTGTGYFNTTASGAFVEWNNVSGGTDGGPRILSFRYALEGNEKNWEILVNGVSQGIIKPLATGMINSWASQDQEVVLRPGNNTVRVRVINVSAGPLIDRMDVYQKANSTTANSPVISPNGGTFTDSVQVGLQCTTPNSTIYYTVDGSTPTTGSTRYSAPFTLSSTATVKAIAAATGLSNSAVASATFTKTTASVGTVAAPSISPNGGTFNPSVQVSLQCATSGASIYYTVDGSTPTTGSKQYSGPFTLTSSATVKAMAAAANMTSSAVTSASFTVSAAGQQAYGGTPWALPGTIEAENYDTGGQGTAYNDLTAGNSGAIYRTDDVDIWLAANSPEGYYTGANTTGEWLEYTVSVATTGQYKFDFRVCTPNSGRQMHVNMDGVNVTGVVAIPNTGSWETWQTVSATANLTAGQHVLRVVFDVGGFNLNRMVVSNAAGLPAAAAPAISPSGGSFSDSVQVSMQCATSGSSIYYTIDGSTPTLTSARYSGPFALKATTTVKAIAAAAGYTNSPVASAVFTKSSSAQQPFGGVAWLLPGTIEAEDYDQGGEGIAFHDTTAANLGNQYRTDGVDIWFSSVVGHYVGATGNGEWLEYTVDVEADGTYSLDLQVATPNSGRTMHIEVDGAKVGGPIAIPNTGSWNAYQMVSTDVDLTEGEHVLRLVFDVGGLNLDWIDVFGIGLSQPVPVPSTAVPVPGKIEAENYREGGEGTAYHDTTVGNSGGVYRTDNVDIWLSGEEGYYTGANASGEWLTYAIDVATARTYTLNLRYATPYTGRTVHLEVDGVNVTGPISLANTGSWNAWQTISKTANLSAGQHVLKVVFDVGGLNFNWVDVK